MQSQIEELQKVDSFDTRLCDFFNALNLFRKGQDQEALKFCDDPYIE